MASWARRGCARRALIVYVVVSIQMYGMDITMTLFLYEAAWEPSRRPLLDHVVHPALDFHSYPHHVVPPIRAYRVSHESIHRGIHAAPY